LSGAPVAAARLQALLDEVLTMVSA
jgi:hypothetical protein